MKAKRQTTQAATSNGVAVAALVILTGTMLTPVPAAGHGGGVDKCGGHTDKKTGLYHVHEQARYCGCHPEAAACRHQPKAQAEPKSPASSDLQSPGNGNTQIDSFHTAKKYAFGVHLENPITIYCGCRFDGELNVDHASCGYKPRGSNKRAHRVEWEHVVPAEAFGQSFTEWREGHPSCVDRKGQPFKGRNCARKASKLFRLMEADVYNLQPAIGEVNNLRSNYSMAELPGEAGEFGECPIKIQDRKFSPRPEVRGDIARTYFYMDTAYPGRGIISRKNRKLFDAWDRMDPVDAWECQRAALIAEVQGNVNTVVRDACAKRSLVDSFSGKSKLPR